MSNPLGEMGLDEENGLGFLPFDPSAPLAAGFNLFSTILGSKAQKDKLKADLKQSKLAAAAQTENLIAQADIEAHKSARLSATMITGGAVLLAAILVFRATGGRSKAPVKK